MRLAVCLLAASIVLPAFAAEPAKDAPKPDAGLKRQFEELGYEYEVDEDGDYKLVFSLDENDKRSQVVFVRSPVETFGAHRIREIWSPGYKAAGDKFPADVANRLLEASQDIKMGGWVKQNNYAVFVVKIPADASTKELDDAIDAAVRSADEIEAELTPGKDDF